MKKIFSVSALAMVATMFYMCSDPKKEILQQIEGLEESLFSDESGRMNMNKANELISAYIRYADEFPEDKSAPDYLFKAGDMSMNLNKPQKAVQLFDRILNTYPDFEKAPQSLFLKGYVYENLLKDLDTAKKIYEEFLLKFPDDDFADDAEMSIRNLGKSPEDLIKEFEEKEKLEKEKGSI